VVGRPVRRQANLVLRFLLEPCALAALFVFEPRVGRHTGEVPRAARGPVRPCRSGAARPRLPWRGRGRAGAVDEEHRQAVHRGPRQKLGARTTSAGQDPRSRRARPARRPATGNGSGRHLRPWPGWPRSAGCRMPRMPLGAAPARPGRNAGNPCRPPAGAASAGSSPRGSSASSSSIATASADWAAEQIASRRAPVGEMPARSTWRHARPPGRLAQHHRLRPPEAASWVPASSSARRGSPWRVRRPDRPHDRPHH
jgi:hypothetical protein